MSGYSRHQSKSICSDEFNKAMVYTVFIPGRGYLFRSAFYTRVFENIAKFKVVLHYVMDGLRHYANARVQALTKKMFFILQRCVLLFYNIFLRCILLLETGVQFHELVTVNRETKCERHICINTNFVEDEPDVLLNLIVVMANNVSDLGRCYKHFSITIPYRTWFVFSISFMSAKFLRHS